MALPSSRQIDVTAPRPGSTYLPDSKEHIEGTWRYVPIPVTNVAGTSSAYTGDTDPPFTSQEAGNRVSFKPNVNNAGACTLNADGQGAASIKLADGADPGANYLKTTTTYDLEHDGTNWVVLGYQDYGDLEGVPTALTEFAGLSRSKGDLVAGEASAWGRLPVGTNGEFLKADSTQATGLAWATPAGGGDMLAANYDPANINEQLVGLTATQTLTNKTLGATTMSGALDMDGQTVTLDADGDAGIRAAGDDDIRIQAGAVDRFFVTNNGTGITSANSGLYGGLELSGTGYQAFAIRSTDASGVVGVLAANSSAELRFNAVTNHKFSIGTNNTGRIEILTTGILNYLDGYTAATTPANFSADNYVELQANGTTVYVPCMTSTW